MELLCDLSLSPGIHRGDAVRLQFPGQKAFADKREGPSIEMPNNHILSTESRFLLTNAHHITNAADPGLRSN